MHSDGDRRGRAGQIHGIPQCLFFGLWALWGNIGLVDLPQIAGIAVFQCSACPTLPVGLFYLAMGGWDEFWFANFVSFFLRAPAPMGRFADNTPSS